jgi:beta-fructofuranosidase
MTGKDHLTALEIRQQMAHDPHRPRYHFQSPSNWMNDPNGFIHWQGEYHLFYQHNPFGPLHANMHWGHAVSEDLVHWRDLPLALTPTPGGFDKEGCWSGCAVDNNGVPTLVYTGVFPEVQIVATSADNLLTWDKHTANPVIAAPPADLEVTGFRDPCVWREADTWYLVIGSGIKNIGGAILLYRSPDLINWEYMHPLCVGNKVETAEMWECPSFFPLGDKHVLFVSVFLFACVEYFVGTYRDYKFEPEFHTPLDYSSLFYAPQSINDAAGRRLLFGWIREARSDALVEAAGWSGMQSVPRILLLRPDGLVGIEPAAELQALRGQHTHYSDRSLSPFTTDKLDDVQGNSLEIIAEFVPGSAQEYGVKLLCSPDGEEETLVVYDRVTQTLTIDRARSCANPEGVEITPQTGTLNLAEGEPLKLHIFLDCSVIEVFANGRMALTSRIYPTRPDSQGLALFTRAGGITLNQMDVWQMNSIWTQ